MTETTQGAKPSLRINAISNWTVLALNILTGFFLTPFIIRHLGESGYGIWTLVCSFIGYCGLLNLGVSSAIHRFIARDLARKDAQALNRVASTAMALFIVAGMLVLFLSFLLASNLAVFFHVDPQKQDAFIHLVRLVGIATAIGFPVEVLGAVVMAREHYVALNTANVMRILIRVTITVLLLKNGLGLIGVGIASIAGTLVFTVMTCFIYRRYSSEICFSPINVDRGTSRRLVTYGGFTTIITLASLLRTELDSAVIGRMIGLAQVGYYGVAALVIRYIFRLIVSMSGILTPRFASMHGAKQHRELQGLFLRSTLLTSLITFFICTQAYLFGERFLDLWVGPEYAPAVPVLHILLICWSLDLSQNSGISLMFALNRHKLYALVMLAESLMNVALSIILAPWLGLIGVAVGTLIPMLLVKVCIQPILVSHIAKVRLIQYTLAILPGLILAVFMVTLIHLLRLPDYLRYCPLMNAIWVALGSVFVSGCLFMKYWLRSEKRRDNERC